MSVFCSVATNPPTSSKLEDTAAPFFAQHPIQNGWRDGYLSLAFHTNPVDGWNNVDLSAPRPAPDRYAIVANDQMSVDVQVAGQADLLRGLAPAAIGPKQYLVRDDEVTALDNYLMPADYELTKQLLERAYIQLTIVQEPAASAALPFVVLPGHPTQDRRYMTNSKIFAVDASFPTHAAYWSTHHVSAFDGDELADLDPSFETKPGQPPSVNLGLTFQTHYIDPRDGVTKGIKPGSYVFMETLRDLYAKPPAWFPTPKATEAIVRQRNAAHELLHALTIPHPANANDHIMCATPMVKADPRGGTMIDADVARLRAIGRPDLSSSPPNACQ